MPYALSTLQNELKARYGLPAEATMAACQSLYARWLITDPKTECAYLPEHLHARAPEVLSTLKVYRYQSYDFTRKSSAWDDSKVTAPHAIIPTGKSWEPSQLNRHELLVMHTILSAYMALFEMEIDMETIGKAYGFTINQAGDLYGLVAGDQGFEPTGIHVEMEGWLLLDRLQEAIKAAPDAEPSAALAEFSQSAGKLAEEPGSLQFTDCLIALLKANRAHGGDPETLVTHALRKLKKTVGDQ